VLVQHFQLFGMEVRDINQPEKPSKTELLLVDYKNLRNICQTVIVYDRTTGDFMEVY